MKLAIVGRGGRVLQDNPCHDNMNISIDIKKRQISNYVVNNFDLVEENYFLSSILILELEETL